MNNLLRDPIIRVVNSRSRKDAMMLPKVLAELSHSTILSFEALRAHQKHAWFAFLVQLAAIALHESGEKNLPLRADKWCELIRALTTMYSDDSPWQLIVEDVAKPAFFQPPVPEGNLAKYKGPIMEPDRLDILVTAKNHDVKMARIRVPKEDHWVYALVTLQTMGGFSGRDNYEIARMNSGYGNRPGVGFAPGLDWGERFRRDVMVLIENRASILDNYTDYCASGGMTLLWTEPWNGQSSLSLSRLDPYFIEICRRVRLVEKGKSIFAYKCPTKSRRIEATDLKGNTGDPWTPVKQPEATALTVPVSGFTYDLLRRLLFGVQYRPGLCQKIYDADPEEGLLLLSSAMTRGQGKTEGIHERILPVPSKVRSLLRHDEGKDRLATLSESRVEDAGHFERRVLRPAMLSILQEGRERFDFKDKRDYKFIVEFRERVDDIFFPLLWESMEKDEEEGRISWRRHLVQIGRDILTEAEQSLPIPSHRRYKALSRAEIVFRGAVRNFLEQSYERKEVG